MSNVFNRITGAYLESVNTPDYPVADWIINPDVSALERVPRRYWKVSGDTVVEMTQDEKDSVDSATVPQPMPEYADNSAAKAAGLGIDVFYRTGDTLKVVH